MNLPNQGDPARIRRDDSRSVRTEFRRLDFTPEVHRLNERQGLALEYLLQSPEMDIRDFARLCPNVSRRSLQRDLATLEAKQLIRHEGETNQLVYKLVDEL